jgi:hypothetical protein
MLKVSTSEIKVKPAKCGVQVISRTE